MESEFLTLEDMPFSRLIVESDDLAEIRREYASKPEKERRLAADFEYHSSMASGMVERALGPIDEGNDPFDGPVLALTIDPEYAPALLTVGSIEYQYGRIDEAMDLFLALVKLSEKDVDIEDMSVVVDKAAGFLIDNEDFENALELFTAAIREHPSKGLYYNGLSYCYARTGQFEEAVEQARRSVELEPANHEYLSDLGWALTEEGNFNEAKTILEKAVAISPSTYKQAKGNLVELKRRMKDAKEK